ncbi:MAG: aminotransferase class V-fold PLP-dependent enzyme [Chloroflexota bacterium]|nr:aminotransferase class V-fold PLP-dependent enzyme [Chloroflexota bacterium]
MIDEGLLTQFPGARGYLNTASLGLPPRVAVDALSAALTEWQAGRAEAAAYDIHVSAARDAFAKMVGTPVEWVATGAQVSALVGMAVTLLRPGARVLCPELEFTSVIFPFLARDDLELDVVTVPLERLAESIDAATDLVAFSLVQSADGRVADVEAVQKAAAANGALTLVDATQAAGWLPFDATDFDVTVSGAYKWLLSPRGTAFMTVRPELLERIQPLYAGWYAGPEPWESIYGLPLRLASDASRLDLSPAWHAWVGTAASLRLLNEVGVEHIHSHDVGLANALRAGLGLEPGDSAMVSLDLDPDFDPARLTGLRAAFRAGRLRVGFHLYSTEDDVERLLGALGG